MPTHDLLYPVEPCKAPAPQVWNDDYTPHCQLPINHIGVDHWADTPIGPCVWSADLVAIHLAAPLRGDEPAPDLS